MSLNRFFETKGEEAPPIEGPPRKIKLAIVVPCTNELKSGFAYDLSVMMATLGATYVAQGIADVKLIFRMGSLVQTQRNGLVKGALEWGATHLLWLDSDMRFPRDLVHRFLRNDEPIIAANCTTRVPPRIHPVAFKTIDPVGTNHERLYTLPENTGLEEVEAIGAAVMMARADVYANMEEPYYDVLYVKGRSGWEGEDVYFCRKARELGFRILIDHDISKDIKHVGEMEFGHDHANAIRDDLVEAGLMIPAPTKLVAPDGSDL